MRKAIGVKQGFGKPWSAPSVTFRVEFSWVNFDDTEDNEQVHWVECRKFQGEERRFLKTHYTESAEDWTEGETIESKFVCVYCASFLVEQMKVLSTRLEALGVRDKPQTMTAESIKLLVPSAYILDFRIVNQAFVFPTPKKGNETIRSPIYQIRWTEELARNTIFNKSIEIVMKNSIYHKF